MYLIFLIEHTSEHLSRAYSTDKTLRILSPVEVLVQDLVIHFKIFHKLSLFN